MKTIEKKNLRRRRRKRHVRKKVGGTPHRPRLTVSRSHKNMYAQIIDDTIGSTLVSASTLEKAAGQKAGGNTEAARRVGEALAAKAVRAGIKKVVFDRNGYAYHGRVKELADAARAGGLEF